MPALQVLSVKQFDLIAPYRLRFSPKGWGPHTDHRILLTVRLYNGTGQAITLKCCMKLQVVGSCIPLGWYGKTYNSICKIYSGDGACTASRGHIAADKCSRS